SLGDVTAQDLARRTPFRLAEIFHDFTAARSGGKLLVTQWVARRAVAEEAMTALELPPGRVGFLDADPADRQGPPPYIRVVQDRVAGRWWLGGASLALVLAAVVLAASATAFRLWQQQVLLDEVGEQLAVVKPKAQQVRVLVDRLERSQARIYRLHMQK